MRARNRPVKNNVPTTAAETQSSQAPEVPAQGTAKAKEKPQSSKARARPSRRATTLTHEQIEERARVIWLKSGCLPGRDEANWYQAEAELKAELGTD
jgi:hypothetical protein